MSFRGVDERSLRLKLHQ